MTISEIAGWVIANWDQILTVAASVVGLASLIVGMTKSPKDDAWVSKIKSFLDRLSILTHADSPGTLKAPLSASKAPEPKSLLLSPAQAEMLRALAESKEQGKVSDWPKG